MTPKETVEAIYTAFQRADIPFILDQLAPDVFWRQPASVPWGGDSTGPEQVSAFFAKLDDLVETTGLEVEDNIEAADEVISYGYYSSRNRLTGKGSRARFVFRWQFRNGKVAHYEAVLDSAPIVTAGQTENVRLIQGLGTGTVVRAGRSSSRRLARTQTRSRCRWSHSRRKATRWSPRAGIKHGSNGQVSGSIRPWCTCGAFVMAWW